jgi:ABC-type dipeptide/oligopeptide/nickel transport system permease subunit
VALASSASISELIEKKPRSPRTQLGDAAYRLSRNRMAVAGAAFIVVLVFSAIFADLIAPRSPTAANLADNYALPGAKYRLGADALGRDVFSRVIYGTRVSLVVAVTAATVSLTIGLIYGLTSAYAGGRVDEVMMRVVDFLYAFPSLIVVILLQVFFKSLARRGHAGGVVGVTLGINDALGGLLFIFVAIGALQWIGMSRLARAQTLSQKEKEFIVAARAIGVRPRRILYRHLLPNILGPCIVQETLMIPGYILLEAFLSFIGLGVDPPTPSWGIMIQEGYQGLRSFPHALFAPAAALALTVLAFNFLGDGLRDALDPSKSGG